ncbi:MAG: 50S ribosomal protein L15 [Thermodesulfobacteriota bacterium]|nr:50S ribosomal protein L15 [Thermodesulfobacteriota bacterium]
MHLNELSYPDGARKKRKRVGRGPGSGKGKTSGKGHKGQKARSGCKLKRGFEGGQMPLKRRLPKRGFTNIFKKHYTIINVKDLNIYDEGSTIDVESLKREGLIKKVRAGIRLLGDGDIEKAFTVKVNYCTKAARKKIESASGKIEII